MDYSFCYQGKKLCLWVTHMPFGQVIWMSTNKHLDTKNNFKRDIIARRENDLKYLPICEMVVDPFTKSILRNMFSVHVKSLGLRRL